MTPSFPAFLIGKFNSISPDANPSGPSAPGTVPAENEFGLMRVSAHPHEPGGRTRGDRSLALDVLRGVAVLAVLFRHAWFEFPPEYGRVAGTLMAGLRHAGWAGVDLFFVLSGFLVSGLLFREYQRDGNVSFGNFFMRRGLKIYPSFMLLLVGYGWVEYLVGDFSFRRLLWETLYVQNYFGGLWNHTWSLAVEEHFYLILGTSVTILVAAGRLRKIVPAVFVVLAVCLGWRIATWLQLGAGHGLRPTHLRMDGLGFGVLLSYGYHFHRAALLAFVERWRWAMLLAVPAMLWPLFVYSVDGVFFSTIGFTFNYLAFGVLLLVCVPAEAMFQRRRAWHWLGWVGNYSYTIYLWHMLISRSVSFIRKSSGLAFPYWAELLYYFSASLLLGWLTAALLERPVLRLRDRLLPSKSGEFPTVAGKA